MFISNTDAEACSIKNEGETGKNISFKFQFLLRPLEIEKTATKIADTYVSCMNAY